MKQSETNFEPGYIYFWKTDRRYKTGGKLIRYEYKNPPVFIKHFNQ